MPLGRRRNKEEWTHRFQRINLHKMMWREFSDFLHLQRRSFVPRQVSEFARIGERPADTIKRIEELTHESLNDIVRGFATSKTWPVLSEEQTLMLYFRLSYGVDLAMALSRCTSDLFSVSENRESEMIQWALNEVWDYPGLPHTLRMFSQKRRIHDETRN
jgi:hypothetical protein